jgi:hypothetical protein
VLAARDAAQALVNVRIYSIGDVNNVKAATAALTSAIGDYTAVTGSVGVGGTTPATLSLTLGSPAGLGAFTPGLTQDYTAHTTADVLSTAGDAALTASGPVHLANGAFTLPSALQVSLSKSSWSAPVSHDPVTIGFTQHIDADDALRTGAYSGTVTFTLSTTTPLWGPPARRPRAAAPGIRPRL